MKPYGRGCFSRCMSFNGFAGLPKTAARNFLAKIGRFSRLNVIFWHTPASELELVSRLDDNPPLVFVNHIQLQLIQIEYCLDQQSLRMESQIKNYLEKLDELMVYTRTTNRAASEAITYSDAFDA
ncbi:hypothetical protein MTR_2g065830 [Medicago truncatula]|uniref:Uncharacterized protein n=1 Tax=Medicago truncatula TaxID=3880 RepID=G7IQW4_MEDTR|nr:hypothetical protein MTR_2g065830 [Medicago truncatula]